MPTRYFKWEAVSGVSGGCSNLNATGLFKYDPIVDGGLDKLAQAWDWGGAGVGRGASNFVRGGAADFVSQFLNQMKSDAQRTMSESPASLVAQSVANGVSAIAGAGGGEGPTASPGLQLVTSTGGQAAEASLSTTGHGPSNATLNSGDSDQSIGGRSISDWSDAAKVPDPSDRSGELAGAGRALQKHGGRDGSSFPAAKGNPAAINEQGQKIVDEILNDPGRTVEQMNRGRYGDVIEVRASDGRGIRYRVDGRFIGFLEPNK
ncbi:hypothetical protein D7S89_25255 [Trinickia fusca]|uniref:Uncharacterized protein n=1 Tax=Trinickia fusca TaxID=2419777 RepID=A0A494X6B9_9BURK|nr:hypothetical protein D7S89_25255 [Trinickia fusca]